MATEMSKDGGAVPPTRLWFGLGAAAIAWVSLGIIDILIVWRVCPGHAPYADAGGYGGARAVSFAISIVLLATAVIAGATSYYNWRRLSGQQNLLRTEATDRAEFMAVLGVFISLTLGIGIVWLSLPPLLIQLCERAK